MLFKAVGRFWQEYLWLIWVFFCLVVKTHNTFDAFEEAVGVCRYLEERKTENDQLPALETEKKVLLSCEISVRLQ